MIVSGDKLTVTKEIAGFLNKGDIVKVTGVNEDGMVSFTFGDNFIGKGFMSLSNCEEHFTKIEDKTEAPTVTMEQIEEIIINSNITVETVFDKCTVVTCKLPNGFVIVESSACVSPENYDEKTGAEICMDKIISKVWELEGYRLQEELYRKNPNKEYTKTHSYDDCNNCEFRNECDECLSTDAQI